MARPPAPAHRQLRGGRPLRPGRAPHALRAVASEGRPSPGARPGGRRTRLLGDRPGAGHRPGDRRALRMEDPQGAALRRAPHDPGDGRQRRLRDLRPSARPRRAGDQERRQPGGARLAGRPAAAPLRAPGAAPTRLPAEPCLGRARRADRRQLAEDLRIRAPSRRHRQDRARRGGILALDRRGAAAGAGLRPRPPRAGGPLPQHHAGERARPPGTRTAGGALRRVRARPPGRVRGRAPEAGRQGSDPRAHPGHRDRLLRGVQDPRAGASGRRGILQPRALSRLPGLRPRSEGGGRRVMTELIARPAAERTPSKTRRRKKTEPARTATPIESVRHALELMKPQLAAVLPAHLPADRLLRVVLNGLQSTPALLGCDRASLYRAVMTCAQLGLEPDGVLGQAWLVPSRGKVQLVPGYQGLIALARNSGQILSINAQAVHRNDHFEYAYGLNERLEHVPAGGDRGEISHFYAYARFKDGGHCFDVMSRAEVDAVRRSGPAEEPAWVNGYAEMGKKTALRRIARFLPLPVQKAAALADLHESGRHAALDDLGEIVVDRPAEAEPQRTEEPQVPPRFRLDAFAAAEMPRVEPPPMEPERIDLSEEEMFALLPPLHILEILDAVAEQEMPEEALESLVGKPLEEVTEVEAPEI